MANKYSIGVDYGTQSGRAVLVNLSNGEEVSEHVTLYKHQVIDEQLPNSKIKLLQDWALQHPQDYVDVLEQSIPAVVKQANVSIDDIIGIGIDFTACTMLPIDKDGEPLCYNSNYTDNPHSWVKLWKHHAAQAEANMINDLAESRQEKWLQRYGGKISSEWMLPKIWQTLREAPQIYEQADQFVEAADWIVSQLTGTIVRNSCTAGYKALWNKREGYPSTEFFTALDERLTNVTTTKLRGEVLPLGTKAGELTAYMAERLQLNKGIAVAVSTIDAHAAVPAVGVVEANQLVMTMGTSICHLLLSDEEKNVPGVSGVVEDGIIPGYFAYEAGQAAVGDILEWYIEEMVPAYVERSAKQQEQNIHQYLTEKASVLKVGESGLLALDWWNGNRSILIDADLTGMIVGLHLQTKPWEIYRALIEATAFGTRKIIETFEQNELSIEQIVACGGLAKKNELLMQIYADVTNKEIKVAASNQTSAVGAAMFAAVAAGAEQGGYATIVDAAAKMARIETKSYQPIEQHVEQYNRLYEEYTTLHDYFGTGINDVMKRLK